MPVLKEYIKPTFELFKKLLEKHYNDINFANNEFINELFEYVYSKKIKGKVDFTSECNAFFKTKRNNKPVSKYTIEYWNSRGHDDVHAAVKISELQSSISPLKESYWINKGFSREEALELISKEQGRRSDLRYEKYDNEQISRQSVWSKQDWLDKGFSEEDSIIESHKRNYACREFWNSDEEYNNIKKIIAKKQKEFIKNNPELYKSFFGSVSKDEVLFFDELKNAITNINHSEFIINVQKSNDLSQGIIKYDGYYKNNDSLILIEYDGLYWHKQEYDEIKDIVCLGIIYDISGII